ncbi:DUF6643 family protein [Streptomyces lavendulae]|uniref:Uncharacterized protein n=1 Tax=Streptomyces lavendulae subsp. lavendulae TaxID=58340 RepID=A0A2K8PNF9_STRLA|nr:DUF6643 family protein [Streptomyces lavendulae]ATZ28271.1 hypothetical protein SLAV_32495 [Streptomyces lavendulae subsp. lavendulae]QUQ58099.1 hypothetical protein SLLC_30665 [Streptomyces lavendulae subsp. lavendulae]GLV99459.1 hypothetical protein Slala05_30910 [Streptomyces lavendulae subsp. lavendulae]
MTSPRSTYGGGYYSAPSFKDTPIYDSLVAERGTPQIAPIRVPAAYESPSAGYSSGGYLPALPSALPALPAAPSAPQQQGGPGYGYQYQQQAAPQQQMPMAMPVPLQNAPAPYIPQQQPMAARAGYVQQPQPQQQPRPAAMGTGYEAMRPAAPRPVAAPAQVPSYEDPYGRQFQGRGY